MKVGLLAFRFEPVMCSSLNERALIASQTIEQELHME